MTYRLGPAGLTASVDDVAVTDVELVSARPDEVVVIAGNVSHRLVVHHTDTVVHVDGAGGSSSFRLVDRFPVPVPQIPPGSLTAPLPGTVVRVEHSLGNASRREPRSWCSKQ